MLKGFIKYLENQERSRSTIRAYRMAIRHLLKHVKPPFTKNKLLKYKQELLKTISARSVNVKIAAINTFLKSIGKQKLILKSVRFQQKVYLEHVLSEVDYNYIKNQLKKKQLWQEYFIVRLLCTTGARISEFCQIKIEHIHQGYFEVYGKGKKYRRVYIPDKVRKEVLIWLNQQQRISGALFLNQQGNPASPDTLRKKLKKIAKLLKVDQTLVYPHTFRHLFAKQFIKKNRDIGLLADLLGHSDIETTRIYLRQTAQEQKATIDKIVDW